MLPQKLSLKDIHLEKATEIDWQTVAKLEKSAASDLFFPLTDKKEILDYLMNSVVYLIHYKDTIIGTISYKIKKDGVIDIDGLTVLPEYRRLGIAKFAMARILSGLGNKKCFELVVHPRNTPALLVYLKLGFLIKSWKDNYFGDGTPRLLLEKTVN